MGDVTRTPREGLYGISIRSSLKCNKFHRNRLNSVNSSLQCICGMALADVARRLRDA